MATALPSTPDQKPSAADFDTIIRIKVGEDEQIFEVHKGILKFYSGYFRSAIENIENGRFKEAEENMITLPEEEADIFKIFQGWVYTRQLPMDNSTSLIKLWAFAGRRIIPLLQNEAIDAIQVRIFKNMEEISARVVYGNAGAGSALRRFTVCSHATCVNQAPDIFIQNWPEEFKNDLLKHMLVEHPRFDPAAFKQRNMCEWHVHEEGVRCQK